MRILISRGKTPADNYVEAVTRAGGEATAVYLPASHEEYDALILAGGGDIDPVFFGEENCGSQEIDIARDRAELALLDAFARSGKPVLGICRGHQLVNIWAGGGLIQDLGKKNAAHRWEGKDKVHPVVTERGFLRELYGKRFFSNSAHHQGVGRLGKGLCAAAWAEDGVVEAMEHERLPVFTVQFHPERMNGRDTAEGDRIFRWFLGKGT
ncbi:MAG: type 1 glutamine amidotransferase [Oscillospiraceae bacterium]|nr:type 1 glutamine amidotransferase [Oscillospiraceae bacterium]